MKQQLWDAALTPDATLEERLSMRMAVMAVLIASKPDSDLGGTAADRAAAAQAVAARLVP
ncbi:hypothetical protein GCM10025876_06640 [Demequina litorisediminis]|uniref:Uncharacterized protein n=1 Tax=Demequina litorisediminis TaxID=1849022 RepID=A0ABQ6I9Q3_9MICO|nr:hypothetical protein GCM10025876_06640 [Demequina litorisediminis]